jgi:hypothetical protein
MIYMGIRMNIKRQQGIREKNWIFSGLLVMDGNSLFIGMAPFLHLIGRRLQNAVNWGFVSGFENITVGTGVLDGP